MPKLLEQVRLHMRARHYSYRTEQSYTHWIRQFILFHQKRHPALMGSDEISAFLTHLAVDRNVSAATQNQALAALLLLYKQVLLVELPRLENIPRAKKPSRLPTVLTREEVNAVLSHLTATKWLMASLLYGSGLRLNECLRLRVKDIDFSYRQITVRDAKGGKDRVTMLPDALVTPLQGHLARVKQLHAQDLSEGFAWPLCPRLWPANIQTRVRPGLGNLSSPLPNGAAIRELTWCGAIMWVSGFCRRR